MPVILAIIAAISGVLFFILRARNAADAAGDLLDMANDVRLAARRFGFSRKANLHPVEAIEEPDIAIVSLASAFIELDDLPTTEQREKLAWEVSKALSISKSEADEICILGRWLVGESGGAEPAVTRLSRKLFRLDPQSFTLALGLISATLADQPNGLSARQADALDDVKRAFRIK